MSLNILIQKWYKDNLRALPWRENKNPYSIWLSEIILQQTQVVQGLPYYEKFIKKYPEVECLANAKEEEVLKLWQGLGYYSRARNLHYAAKQIVDQYTGIFPNNYKELLNLKGVGDYTASAIASIAFGEAVPTVDGNVLRVISRVFDVDTPVDTNKGKNEIKNLMFEILDKNNPGDFNQAVMELGAKICKPKNPDCIACPIQVKCLAYDKQNFLERPVKSKKVKVESLFIDFLYLYNSKGFVLQQRDDKGIWKKLFELPSSFSKIDFFDFKHLENIRNLYSKLDNEIFYVKSVKHKLTHRNLNIRFFNCAIEEDAHVSSFKLAKTKAVPKPIEDFMAKLLTRRG